MNKIRNICIRISELDFAMLKSDAKKQQMSMSEYLRYLVRKNHETIMP